MVAYIFAINGHVAAILVSLEQCRRVNSEWYATLCLPVDVLGTHVLEIPQSESQKCFDNSFKRMQNCKGRNAEYFENQ